MAAAIEKPEFDRIRSSIIEITLNDALFEGSVAIMVERVKALPLTGEDLNRYMESVIQDGSGSGSSGKIDILFTEPEAALQWVSEARDESDHGTMIPDMVLNWAKPDAKAAFGWVGEQALSPLSDATIARLVTKGPTQSGSGIGRGLGPGNSGPNPEGEHAAGVAQSGSMTP